MRKNGSRVLAILLCLAMMSSFCTVAMATSDAGSQSSSDSAATDTTDSGGGGGMPPVESAPTSAAIYVDASGLSTAAYDKATYSTASGAAGVTATGADGIIMSSTDYGATGIVATGKGVNFTLGGEKDYYTLGNEGFNSILYFGVGSVIDSSAKSGAATAVDNGATMNIVNSYIQADGAGRYTVSNYNDGTLVINDSTIVATGKSVNKNTDAITDPFSNAALLINGTSRANFSIGQSQTYYINSYCIADGWAAMSTDSATGTGLDLYSYYSTAVAENGGYGTYADSNCRVWLYGSLITGGELGAIISNNGQVLASDGASATANVTDKVLGGKTDGETILAGGRNGVQIHSPDMMGQGATGEQTATLTVTNSAVGADKSLITSGALDYTAKYGAAIGAYVNHISGSAILVKSTSANINLTNATVATYNNTLVQTVLNSDSMGRFLKAGDNKKVDPVTVNMKDMSATGDIRHEDYQRNMVVNLDNAQLSGAVVKGTYDSWTALWSGMDGAKNWNPNTSWDGTNDLTVNLTNGAVWTVTGASTVSSLTVSADSKVVGTMKYDSKTDNSDGSVTYANVTLNQAAASGIAVSNGVINATDGTATVNVNGDTVTRNTISKSITSYTNRDDTYIFGLHFQNGSLNSKTSVLSDAADVTMANGVNTVSGLNLNIDKVSGFNSVVADKAAVNVEKANINNDGSNSNGTDASDFTAVNSTFTAINGASLNISGSTVVTKGFLRTGFIVDGSSEITVQNSNFTTYGDSDPFKDNTTNISNSANQNKMIAPPWVLGIYGSIRTGNMLGKYGTLNVIGSTLTTGSWAVLSVDACTSPVINVVDSNLKAITLKDGGLDSGEKLFGYSRSYGSGYGSYFIGGAYEYFYGANFDGLTYAGIYTGGTGVYKSSNGTITLLNGSETTNSGVSDGSTIVGKGANTVINTVFGFMAHGDANISVLDGTQVNTEDATFLVKSGTVNLTVDDATLKTSNGVILQMMDNDDTVVGMGDPSTMTFNTTFKEAAGWPGIDKTTDTSTSTSTSTATDTSTSTSTSTTTDTSTSTSTNTSTGTSTSTDTGTSTGTGTSTDNGGQGGPGGGPGGGSSGPAVISLTNGTYNGDLYNGTGYVGTANTMKVTIGKDATLDGAISATSFIHSSDGGKTQNTSFDIHQYYLLGHVVNRPYYNGSNGISVTLADNAVWTVEPAGIKDEPAVITELTIGDKATVKAPDGYTLTATVDGQTTTLQAGQTYKGKIVLTVSKSVTPSGNTGSVVIASDGSITLDGKSFTSSKLITVTDKNGVEVTGIAGTYDNATITETSSISDNYSYRTGLYVDSTGVVTDKSVLPALSGVSYDSTSATGGTIVSKGKNFNGFYLDGAKYSIKNVKLTMTNNGANDFVGFGAGVLATGTSEVTIDGSTIQNQGVVRTTVVAMGSAKVLVMNSTLSAADGTQDSGYVGTVSPTGMKSVPWMLGLNGNARATNLLGSATATYFKDTVSAEKWGVLSTDDNKGVSLYAINTNAYISGGMKDIDKVKSLAASGSYDFYNDTIGRNYLSTSPFGSSEKPSGYGTYSIGATQVIFAGSTVVAPTYIGICANGASGITLTSSKASNISNAYGYDTIKSSVAETVTKAYSERFGLMYHSGEGTGNTYVNDGTELYTGETSFLVKGCGTNINVDNAALKSGTNVILQVIDNDDAGIDFQNGMATTVAYTEKHGTGTTNYTDGKVSEKGTKTTANFSNMTLNGNIFNSSGYEGASDATGSSSSLAGGGNSTTDLTVNLDSVKYTGVISTSESWHNHYSDATTKTINPADYEYLSSKTDTVSTPAYAEVIVNLKNTTWTVSGTGYLTALTVDANSTINGTVYVNNVKTVPQAGVTYTGVIKVTKTESTPVTSITVSGATSMEVGKTLQMSATVLPANATDSSVTWSVKNGTGSATISTAGLLSATSAGTVTVTATANDGSKVAGSMTVTITASTTAVTSIAVNGATSMVAGYTQQMSATVLPDKATDKTVTWSVKNGTGSATISTAGLLSATGAGTVTVTATAKDGSGVAGSLVISIISYSGGGSYSGGTTTTTTTRYTVTVSAGEGGSISSSATEVTKSGSATITVTPKDGYVISDVLVNGVSVGAVSSYTVQNITANVTVKAVFKVKADTEKTWTNPYPDVAANAWYFDAVKFVTEKGIMKGMDGGAFNPDGSMTRAMFVTVLFRLSGATAGGTSGNFADVLSGSWYEASVAWANTNGIAKGFGNGTFGPDATMTREQMVVMLYNFAKYMGLTTTSSGSMDGFTDAGSASSWASDAMKWAIAVGIISGDDNHKLNSNASATRAENAKMLQTFESILEKAKK
jgi:hypothetical protein